MTGIEGRSSFPEREDSSSRLEIGGSGARMAGLNDTSAEKILEAFTLFLQQQKANERKEDLATQALHAVVQKLDQFDGRDISKYLRIYKKEMELNRVPEKEMINAFELAVVPEIRDYVKRVIGNYGANWETFSRTMKEEYFLEDSDRVTKKSFLDWVECPNKGLHPTELLREFERQFSQLSRVERMTLQSDRTELFLRAADPELQGKLELLLEDKDADEGLTTNWKNVEDAIGLISKREKRKEKINAVRRFIPTSTPARVPLQPVAPISQPAAPIVQPRVAVPTPPKKEDAMLEEILRGMRDLNIKYARLEEKTSGVEARALARSQGRVQHCMWCDSTDHSRKECNDFTESIRQGVVFWKDGKIALRDSGDLLQTNFGKGGMKKMVEDYFAANAVTAVEAACYTIGGSCIVDGTSGHVKTDQRWSDALLSAKRGKTPKEILLRAASSIRKTTGWDDPIQTLSVHAFIANSQHEALVEEKRRREDEGEGSSTKKLNRLQTQVEKSRQEPLPEDILMKEATTKLPTKEKEAARDKGKGPAYKLQSDVEAAVNIKEVIEKRILNSKIEISLRELMGLAKREVHDFLIDGVKKKRQTADDAAVVHTIEVLAAGKGEKEEVEEDDDNLVSVCEQSLEPQERHVRWEDEEGELPASHYSIDHWARGTTETLVKLDHLDEQIMALIDHGSEINIMSMGVYKRGNWPIDLGHGWMIRAANNSRGGLYGACPSVNVKIGNVAVDQKIFVQEKASFPVILGQPFIIAVRMETKVLDDGSAYARIRSKDDERISGLYEEIGLEDVLDKLKGIEEGDEDVIVNIHSRELYSALEAFGAVEAIVETKYKTVAKKVKPMAVPLPVDSREQIERASKEKSLRDPSRIGHKFTDATLEELRIGVDGTLLLTEKECFKKMLKRHGKAFAFESHEIGCVDPSIVSPMIIFTVPHAPWDLRPIPVPRAHLPKLVELLKEKMKMKILEPSVAPYSSRWFTVPKKNGSLRFIQDMQPVNGVTIRNVGVGPIVDEYAEAFAGRAIYSMGDLYSGYDQFQLAEGSRDITTMKTPLGLVRMCTLPQGATNSVAHMMSGMNKILRDFVPEKTMPFLDDVPIKGCIEEDKDETLDQRGCRRYVVEHIADCEKILSRLEEVNLTLSGAKTIFGVREVVIVGHLCGSFGRKPDPIKIDVIQRMKGICSSLTEVRRFLGTCIFYHIWIPHYAHIAEPMYRLCRKGQKFEWEDQQAEAMKKLKAQLSTAPVLGRVDYQCGRPVILTVDTSPIAIGWAVGQDDVQWNRFAVRFGARVLSMRQRAYPQVKRELWGVVTAMKAEKEYLIGAAVVIETDCLPLLGMITNCSTSDMAMLNWIAYIKSLNPEFRHIAGKENVVADMLSRARYDGEEEMIEDTDEVGTEFYSISHMSGVDGDRFEEDLYEGELADIGKYLSTLQRKEGWTDAEYRRIRRKSYNYLLRDGYLWKRPKRSDGTPLRVVCGIENQRELIKEFHESLWAGHRGIWATFMKLKERYWWKNIYRDVVAFVESCVTCQMYSNIRHRDGLRPTYPPAIHFKWVVDLVTMPIGIWGMRYLALAREDLSNQVEGRALRRNTTEAVCRFLLEDVVCRYGCVGRITADGGELNAKEAEDFFNRYGLKLALTTAYNPEGNAKSERGHPPIVKALVKYCSGKAREWPRFLPFALWADRTTHSAVTGYMPAELIQGQKPIMPMEEQVKTWSVLPWKDDLTREELLELRIRQLDQRAEDVQTALDRLKEARLKNKGRFDKRHRLRPTPIQEGDWVLVYDNSLDNQHSALRKFSKRWFGPYVVLQVNDNTTYGLRELDGTQLRRPIAGKRVKIFKRRDGQTEADIFADDEDQHVHEDEEFEDEGPE
ncbi:hypothetical protein R1sor_006544 [Riccia sorocarpa]|uniref:Integrase catalytic domain-containing protein n=1 Tax=Riccia sorocarpa TaxID=122646 RepID=A0ABD3HND1_9MARC